MSGPSREGKGADASELEAETRLSLYKRTEIRALLSYTVNGHEKIQPTLTNEGYAYPEISKLLKLGDSTSVLEEVAKQGVYRRSTVDVEAACPDCGSRMTIHDSYACPFCKSPSLKRGTLLEHYKCGHVGLMDEFAQADNLICPKCRGVLRLIGTDYSKIQDTFRCDKCSRSFVAPSIIHRCLTCKNRFSYENAKLSPVYTYEFNERFRQEVTSNCVVQFPIMNLLSDMGFNVQSPGVIKGQSGVGQDFDIVARYGSKNYVFSIATDATEVNQEAVATLFAKKFDVEAEKSFVVAIPKMSHEGLNLAKLYGIEVIQGSDQNEVTHKIAPLFDWVKQPQALTQVAPTATVEVQRPTTTFSVSEAVQQVSQLAEQTRKMADKPTAQPIPNAWEDRAVEFGKPAELLTRVPAKGEPAQRQALDSINCSYCGRQLSADAEFCDQCGRIINGLQDVGEGTSRRRAQS